MKTILEIPNAVANRGTEIELKSEPDESIRKRAYELYEQRGHIDGHELEDWLQAEAEVKEQAVAA
jgi:hypothetical protein